MSYENAPATRLVATHCAVCARPLVDAPSVESGIGPVCREKYGLNVDMAEDVRREANRLVYQIAAHQKGISVAQAVGRLRELGLEKLASRIAERAADIVIEEDGEDLVVRAPYLPEAIPAFRGIRGRRWDKEAKANRVPARARRELWLLLQRFYSGSVGVGPKGGFEVWGS